MICARLLTLTTLSFLLFRCATEKPSQPDRLSLIETDSLTVPLDKSTSKNWSLIQYFTSGTQEYIVFQDFIKTNSDYINFFDLVTKKIAFKVTIAKDGPNGMGGLSGFYVHSLDSIFILSSYSYSLYLTDTSGVIKNTYKLIRDNAPGKNTSLPTVRTNRPIFKFNHHLYIPAIADEDPYFNDYKQKNLLINLNLESNTFTYQIGYPEIYKKGYWGLDHALPSFAYNSTENIIVVNYPVDQAVYFYTDSALHSVGEVRSNLINNEPVPLKKYVEDREDVLDFQLGTDQFNSVYYDQYRDLYYRICLQKYDNESISKMKQGEAGLPAPYSLIIFNKHFEKLAEEKFERGAYSLGHFVVTKNGILIRKNSQSEDEQTFVLFSVKKL